jgi:hypothetical protein
LMQRRARLMMQLVSSSPSSSISESRALLLLLFSRRSVIVRQQSLSSTLQTVTSKRLLLLRPLQATSQSRAKTLTLLSSRRHATLGGGRIRPGLRTICRKTSISCPQLSLDSTIVLRELQMIASVSIGRTTENSQLCSLIIFRTCLNARFSRHRIPLKTNSRAIRLPSALKKPSMAVPISFLSPSPLKCSTRPLLSHKLN